jgi:hypothetical protein
MFGEVLEESRQLEMETFDVERIADAEEEFGLALNCSTSCSCSTACRSCLASWEQ